MITLVGKPGEASPAPKIRFTPRQGFKTTTETLEYDLLYGHYCPRCANVVQACFVAPEPVDLWPYEETRVMSLGKSEKTAGTILRVVPNNQSNPDTTNYRQTTLKGSGESAQHLVLANHVLRYHGIGQPPTISDRHLEPLTERCCEYAGVFSLRADLVLPDACLILGVPYGSLAGYNLPTLDEFLASPAVQEDGFRQLPAYGTAPPVLLVPLDWIRGVGNRVWQTERLLKPWAKKEKTSTVVVPF